MTVPTTGPFDGDEPSGNKPFTTGIGQVVRVTAFGHDTVEVPFEADSHRSIQYYLDAANAKVGRRQMVTLNGKTVWRILLKVTKVTEPGATIVVTNKVKNG